MTEDRRNEVLAGYFKRIFQSLMRWKQHIVITPLSLLTSSS